MPRMRRWRIIRILLLLATGWILWSNHHKIVLPSRTLSPRTPIYTSHATYNYTSIYREHANRSFEDSLDAKLDALSQTALKSNSKLKASLNIHQIGTAESVRQYGNFIKQWRTSNPGWGYELVTGHPERLLDLYDSVPEISTAYNTYPALQHDLAKYLMLWAHGGFYTDVDTWPRFSLRDCPPITEGTHRDVSLMVGVERDEVFFNDVELQARGWSRRFGFGTHTLWALQRFDPVLRQAIVRSISHAQTRRELSGSGNLVAAIQRTAVWDHEEAWEISGGGVLTDIVLEVLNESLKEEHWPGDKEVGTERKLSWKPFRLLKWNLWFDTWKAKEESGMRGIAIVPVTLWNNGQNHSASGPFDSRSACVNHVSSLSSTDAWYKKGFW
jgi:alpha 1,6-mannosyltransferase